ncbi:MAG: MscL family protein, partial [Methanobacteriota archaeon]
MRIERESGSDPDVGLFSEFLEFLKEYKVIALTVAFIMGVAVTALIMPLVDNIIMPFIGVLIHQA